jgi:hypothetical protein
MTDLSTLLSLCWCGGEFVWVKPEHIKAGKTQPCKKARCKRQHAEATGSTEMDL